MSKLKLFNYSTFLLVAGLLFGAYYLIEISPLDRLIQDQLYVMDQGRWLVDRNEPVLRFLIYKLPKYFLALLGLSILWKAFQNRKNKSSMKKYITLFFAIGLTPVVCSNLKHVTNTYCPWDLKEYGGSQPYVKFLEAYPKSYVQPERKPKCFPAGTPSAGFSLIAFFFFFYDHPKRKMKWLGLLSGIALGHIMGIYQMAKGAHFYSHNFASMSLAWLIGWLVFKIYKMSEGQAKPTEA